MAKRKRDPKLPPMSDEDFVRTTMATGGASRAGRTGRPPGPSGYMVGVRGHELTVPSRSFGVPDVQHHSASAATPLRVSGNYQGSWRPDDDQGRVVMDVSSRRAHFSDAITKALSHDQEAIYDLGSQREIKTAPYRSPGSVGARLVGDMRASRAKHRTSPVGPVLFRTKG